MKNIVCALSLMLICFCCFSDEYVISKFTGDDATYATEREISFKYDDEKDVYYFYRATGNQCCWYEIKPAQLPQLRTTLAKAKEWETIARENKTDVTKDIPNSKLNVSPTQIYGTNMYRSSIQLPLMFFYIGKFAENEYSALYIPEMSVPAKENRYWDIEWDPIIFIGEQIDKFIEAVSEETVTAAIQKHNSTTKQNADLFN